MRKFSWFIGLVLWLLAKTVFASDVSFESLKCESQVNPICVEAQQPLLSWIVKAEGYNRSQTAYQLIVASSPELLNEQDADMWNTGKIVNEQSSFVKYGGKMLEPVQTYWWKVKIWDEKDEASNWSSANTFEMGLMNEGQWKNAKWICVSNDNRKSEHRFREYQTGKMDEPAMVTSQAAGYFRNVFETDKKIKAARAYVCGLGYYELYINGEKTGDHVLDPAPSNYDSQAYYVSYDVTDQLKTGKNALGIILGNGFYGQDISWKSDPESERDLSFGIPAVRLLVKITYEDGTEQDVISDADWKNSTGPIVFDNIYGGEIYDARYKIGAWNTAGFDDKDWEPAKTIQPKVKEIGIQDIPPIRKLKELNPQRVFKSSGGNWIVDFGQNIAGWVKISVQGEKGQAIKITTTEALTQDGKDIYPGSTGGGANGMAQWLKYICNGEGTETWEPRFTYHGFRYAQLEGVTEKPDAEMIKAILVATDMEEKGSFSCSDATLNKMDTISKWTIVDNMHGIPEDCPHREKCGWLGDAHAFCEYALYNYELLNFYKKYMIDIRTQRRLVNGGDKSAEKYRVPTMIAPGRRTSSIAKLDWGIAAIYLPWYNFIHYGDSSMVKEYYDDMKELTEYYLTFKDEQGIIQNGMGDWCPPRWDRRQNPEAMECNPIVSANAYFYDILGIMQRFAAMNDDANYAMKMKEEKEALQNAFNTVYLENIPLVGLKWYGSQTATVMALQFGMVPQDELDNVVDGLCYNITAVKGGHHAVGIHGMRYIYTVLSKYGNAELAHEILTTPTFPSQTYVMNYGFTTWPERQFFWEEMDGLSNSLNHPMHSGFAAYFYESLGGIKSSYNQPGYKEFTVDPIFPQAIKTATVAVPTRYGQISNSWEMDDSKLTLNLTVPFNTKAKLVLSANELQSLLINGESWENKSDVILGSGEYKITYVKDRD